MDVLFDYLRDTGLAQFHWTNGVMLLIGMTFLFLAVVKKFEPLLLAPIGFGILIGNIPYDTAKLSLGVYDGPVSDHEIAYFVAAEGQPELDLHNPERDPSASIGPLAALPDHQRHLGDALVHQGKAVMVNTHDTLSGPDPPAEGDAGGAYIRDLGQGRQILVSGLTHNKGDKYGQVWSPEKQDIHNASVFWFLFAGVGLMGIYPPLIFLGVGALTDFGPMLSNPKTLLLGAAAQFGIFAAFLGAAALPIFNLQEAASIGIIGGADGPTAIFT
ncbi:MAG: sodium ion-translocating decarboxylase subunit beta, partial [Planctomycetota bacterium]